MDYPIEEITARLDRIVDKYLTRDSQGRIVYEMGQIQPTRDWGNLFPNPIDNLWRLNYELPPSFSSSARLSFEYHHDASMYQTRRELGFYIDNEFVGDDLEKALEVFEEKLVSIETKPLES